MTEDEITAGAALRAGLEGLRRTHATSEMDCWYACPKSGECCDDSRIPDRCTCGADAYNAAIDQLLPEIGRMEADNATLRHALANLLSAVRALHIAEAAQPDRPERTTLEQRLVLRAAEAQQLLGWPGGDT